MGISGFGLWRVVGGGFDNECGAPVFGWMDDGFFFFLVSFSSLCGRGGFWPF